jgi:hypothetical protein
MRKEDIIQHHTNTLLQSGTVNDDNPGDVPATEYQTEGDQFTQGIEQREKRVERDRKSNINKQPKHESIVHDKEGR